MERIIYTIGHSNRKLEDFMRLLKKFKIELLYDVRSFPTSRVAPHFSKDMLSKTLAEAGIEYIWDRRLGGYRKFGKDVKDIGIATCFKSEGFRAYATYLVSCEEALKAVEKLSLLAEKLRTAIMCSERLPWRCHRKILSDLMIAREFKVIHIIDEDWQVRHKLSRCAQVINGVLVYD